MSLVFCTAIMGIPTVPHCQPCIHSYALSDPSGLSFQARLLNRPGSTCARVRGCRWPPLGRDPPAEEPEKAENWISISYLSAIDSMFIPRW